MNSPLPIYFRLAFHAMLLGSVLPASSIAAGSEASNDSIERGEYLARVAGCNDCHTAGYPESGGNIPMDQWLTGMNVGFQGPWGTTYPANLRLYFANLDEEQWLARARSPMMPPCHGSLCVIWTMKICWPFTTS